MYARPVCTLYKVKQTKKLFKYLYDGVCLSGRRQHPLSQLSSAPCHSLGCRLTCPCFFGSTLFASQACRSTSRAAANISCCLIACLSPTTVHPRSLTLISSAPCRKLCRKTGYSNCPSTLPSLSIPHSDLTGQIGPSVLLV